MKPSEEINQLKAQQRESGEQHEQSTEELEGFQRTQKKLKSDSVRVSNTYGWRLKRGVWAQPGNGIP
jgi:hypothetical protein